MIKDNGSDTNSIGKGVSFLSPDAVRWINKRQPEITMRKHAKVLPVRALQLKEIFKGLDFDGSGSIDVNELRAAIEYVSKAKGEDNLPLLKEPANLTDFFLSMDTNNDGAVDFNEFLVALTAQIDHDDVGQKNIELREAFLDFTKNHRRQKILDFVSDPSKGDLEKYKEMRSLFNIQYFHKQEELVLSTDEKLSRAKQIVKKQMKEIHTKDYLKQKKKEQLRAREALLYFKDRQFEDAIPSISRPYLPNLLEKPIPDEVVALSKAQKDLRHKFSEFSLHMEKTFTPRAQHVKHNIDEQVRLKARSEALVVKNDKYLKKNLPPIAPPIPMRIRTATPM
jgi:hypothetical protein